MTDPLPNIERGPTWTENHRAACLARYVANLPATARESFIQRYRALHGNELAEDLLRQAREAWRSARRR